MRIKFKGALILTMDEKRPFIEDGCVVVEGEKIAYCGKDEAGPCDEEVDVSGDILMPGLINCHAHLAMSLFRGTAESSNLKEWLYNKVFPMEKRLTCDDVFWGTMLAIAECARGGITTVADTYFFNEAAAEAAEISGMGLVLMGADMDIEGNTQAVLEKVRRDYERYGAMGIKYIPGCHSVYTCSQRLIEGIADFACQVKSKTYIHLSETLEEVGECANEHGGLTPPQYLHKCGFFDYGGIAAHCVHVDKDDILLLKQQGVYPMHCPASNLKLGSGIAPVYSMLYHGLEVALGTDSSASNNRLDMFREMYLASVLQKGSMNRADAVSELEALRMATVNGAKALGLKTGMIKEGYDSDIIRVSAKGPDFKPKNTNVAGQLVYAASSHDVVMTMCKGKVLYEDGNFHIGIDTDRIYSECDSRINRLLKSI
jgi:5-methylthioadenosine/S-adenosylhomocysteine deaminase